MKRIYLIAPCLMGLVLAIFMTISIPQTASAAPVTLTCENGSQVTIDDAATAQEKADACGTSCSGSFLGLPTWHKYIDKASVTKEGITDPCALQMPEDANGKTDWAAVSGRVGLALVEIMTRLAAIVAVAFVILGGFRYITSQGEPDNTKSARQTITNGLIGLVVSLIATGTVAFIAGQFT